MVEEGDFELDNEERKRVRRLYSSKRARANAKGIGFNFLSPERFAEWWEAKFQKQRGCCAYCETPISVIARIIEKESARSRNVRGGGRRGPKLELERKKSRGPYSEENCSLVCYYCNNDKSYIYDDDEYKKFFGPARRKHFKFLAETYDIAWPNTARCDMYAAPRPE